MISLVILVSPSLTQNAFATTISSAIAADPNGGDDRYSVSDTITITFDGPTNATSGLTMTNAEFRANFTVNTSTIDTHDTVTGVWTSTSILTLTINTITGSDHPILFLDQISYDVSNGDLGTAAGGSGANGCCELTSTPIVLQGSFVLGGDSCNNCNKPTLGIYNDGRRMVDDGFTYNGKSIDVEQYFTPYPLVTVQTGMENTAEFKIFDQNGPDDISHFELAFGLANGESIGMSKVVINWDKSFDGVETVTLNDPENVLENVQVTTSEDYCLDGQSQKCLVVQMMHTFRAPLDFNIIGTNVWDVSHNAWQNYYNHGIEIVGESLNPPKIYGGIDAGYIYHLTETGKTTAIDEFGNTWSFSNTWIKNYIKNEKLQDTDWNVMTRNHSDFGNLVDDEIAKAEAKLLVLCTTCLESFDDFALSTTIIYPERFNKLDDPEIQKTLSFEYERAQETMNDLLNNYR